MHLVAIFRPARTEATIKLSYKTCGDTNLHNTAINAALQAKLEQPRWPIIQSRSIRKTLYTSSLSPGDVR